MILGKVVGNTWATRKEDGLNGLKFLIVQPININGKRDEAKSIIAVDRIGAGVNDIVLITQGSPASIIGERKVPIDAVIIGIIDEKVESGE
ncbi:EutN/CcmL family microcompartment protein [Psychrobacillus soli]|uniref:Ethanolamine utilization protein EutN n=1 Tax=Psychrobacillus soli TaxID=1543965 RepID=A0A544SU34_9BACI|nr:EutN/CcmL family microcompartment protein [Psychrobacillus soli]TQR08740.1 ethanolamine utilization protein EutN [Psychrobacillus soli]